MMTSSTLITAISGQRRVIEAAPNSAPIAERRHMSRRIHAQLQVGDT